MAATGKPAPVAEVDLRVIREGAQTMIGLAIEKAVALLSELQGGPAGLLTAEALAAKAQALERAVYNSSVRSSRTNARLTHRRIYADTLRVVTQALGAQVGPYPDDVVAVKYVAGRQTADEAVDGALKAQNDEPDARETIRRLFVRKLMLEPVYAHSRERALETARLIEVSCFNAAVRASRESEEPPRRQWDSPPFVDIYSTRCGTIAGLLDPTSSSCRAYGATLVQRLLAGALRPEQLGELTEKELCPQAMAAERAEIAKRSEQRVAEKESMMFRCPHCGQRRCTYREVQRRSLDEAPDYLCFCLNCNHRFTGRS
jgi:DNA-directed RNA polymerase subunit M/transcription elongation factor TFIIS